VFRSVRRPRCDCDYDEMCHILEGAVHLTNADDASCEQSGLRLAWERRQPVRQRKFQGWLQGV
jgi:hypothetical protein